MADHFDWRDFAQGGVVLGAAGVVGTLVRWRNWHNPTDMKQADGSPHPRAGKFSAVKMIGDFVFVPALIVIGLALMNVFRVLNIRWGDAGVICGVCVCAMLGSVFLMGAMEKARDTIIGAIGRRIGGGTP
ncbi:MAG: hypothetical protein WDM81_13650 [Rhizomicrobium sp.]